MELLQRFWHENKRFLLITGGGLALFLILNSCIVTPLVGNPSKERAKNQALEVEINKIRNEVIQRAPEEKRNLRDLKQIESELSARFLTQPPADIPDSSRGAPQIQFTERIERIWSDLRSKANQRNVRIPERITPSDLGVDQGDGEVENRRNASYLEILGRALRTCVEAGMVQIDKPVINQEEYLYVREDEEVLTVYRRIGLMAYGPYDAFKRVLREFQNPGFVQVRLLNLDSKGSGGANTLRGQFEFVGVLLEGEKVGEQEKTPPKETKTPPRKPSRKKKS